MVRFQLWIQLIKEELIIQRAGVRLTLIARFKKNILILKLLQTDDYNVIYCDVIFLKC